MKAMGPFREVSVVRHGTDIGMLGMKSNQDLGSIKQYMRNPDNYVVIDAEETITQLFGTMTWQRTWKRAAP